MTEQGKPPLPPAGGGGRRRVAGGRPSGLDRRHHGRRQRPGLRSGCAGGGGKRAAPARMNWNALRAIRRTRLDANECKWITPFRLPADSPSEPSARHGATCASLRTALTEEGRLATLELRCIASCQLRSLLAQRTGSASLSFIHLRAIGGGCAHHQLGIGGRIASTALGRTCLTIIGRDS